MAKPKRKKANQGYSDEDVEQLIRERTELSHRAQGAGIGQPKQSGGGPKKRLLYDPVLGVVIRTLTGGTGMRAGARAGIRAGRKRRKRK